MNDKRSIQESILLKLLDAEIARSNNNEDVDDRREALAQLSEGADIVLDRIKTGIRKYVALLDPERDAPMQEFSVEQPEASDEELFFEHIRRFFKMNFSSDYLKKDFLQSITSGATPSGALEITLTIDSVRAAMSSQEIRSRARYRI